MNFKKENYCATTKVCAETFLSAGWRPSARNLLLSKRNVSSYSSSGFSNSQ